MWEMNGEPLPKIHGFPVCSAQWESVEERKGKWVWRTWEIDLPCDVEGWVEIVCRRWDTSLNTQPLTVRATWNWGLHVTSSAHRVKVYIQYEPQSETDEKTTGEIRPCQFAVGASDVVGGVSDAEYGRVWSMSGSGGKMNREMLRTDLLLYAAGYWRVLDDSV